MDLNNLLAISTVWGILKIFVLVGLGVYVVFAIVLVRQVRLMMDTVHLGLEGLLVIFSWMHLFLALGFLVGAFLFL